MVGLVARRLAVQRVPVMQGKIMVVAVVAVLTPVLVVLVRLGL
jgi:hypothetical protein